MSDLKQSLTRKLGPLPVWAWALIAGAAVYVYRVRKAGGAIGGALGAATTGATTGATGGASSGDTGAGGGGGDTGGGGSSPIDPGANPLTGEAPSQQAPEVFPPESPVTLEPGESVYDPNTGKLLGGATKKKATKRKVKAKPKQKGAHIPKPGHHAHKKKTRSIPKILNPLHKHTKHKPPSSTRGSGPAATPQTRVRAHSKGHPTPALKQHTAAPRVVHHGQQRVAANHPAAPHPVPVVHAHPRRRKKR